MTDAGAPAPIKIEKNVPRPTIRRPRHTRYHFEQMKPGDSFFVAYPAAHSLRTCVRRFIRRHADTWEFECRTWEQKGVPGLRVWRIK